MSLTLGADRALAKDAPARRRVLIVTSSYAPTMIADMHRARHLAWELPKLGWDVEILTPDESFQPVSCLDEDSADFFPGCGKVTVVRPFLAPFFRWLGVRTIGWRAIVPLFFVGGRIVRQRTDLVYFSTTQFSLFLLGPLWRMLFGVPYVLDFHDPCVREEAGQPRWMGRGRLKYALTRGLMKGIEAAATRRASALVSVSPRYLDVLTRRYGAARPEWTKPRRAEVIPFAALERDLAIAAPRGAENRHAANDVVRIVYVGAGGPIMARAFALLCDAFVAARAADPRSLEHIRVELYGTVLGWEQSGGRKYLAEIAAERNLCDIVTEWPGRVSYRRSLELLMTADGVLILGVEDPGYMPSKLFSYALSGKPLLAVLHREGPAYRTLERTPSLGEAIWFDAANATPAESAAAAVTRFLRDCVQHRCIDRRTALETYLAPAMARRHAELFEACLARR